MISNKDHEGDWLCESPFHNLYYFHKFSDFSMTVDINLNDFSYFQYDSCHRLYGYSDYWKHEKYWHINNKLLNNFKLGKTGFYK